MHNPHGKADNIITDYALKKIRKGAGKMVEVYFSENCIWCRRMRSYLDGKGVAFRTINAREPFNSRHVIRLTGQSSLPVTVIGNTTVIGFDKQAVDMALQNMQ